MRRRREVADRDVDPLRARFRTKSLDHRLREVDPLHPDRRAARAAARCDRCRSPSSSASPSPASSARKSTAGSITAGSNISADSSSYRRRHLLAEVVLGHAPHSAKDRRARAALSPARTARCSSLKGRRPAIWRPPGPLTTSLRKRAPRRPKRRRRAGRTVGARRGRQPVQPPGSGRVPSRHRLRRRRARPGEPAAYAVVRACHDRHVRAELPLELEPRARATRTRPPRRRADDAVPDDQPSEGDLRRRRSRRQRTLGGHVAGAGRRIVDLDRMAAAGPPVPSPALVVERAVDLGLRRASPRDERRRAPMAAEARGRSPRRPGRSPRAPARSVSALVGARGRSARTGRSRCSGTASGRWPPGSASR